MAGRDAIAGRAALAVLVALLAGCSSKPMDFDSLAKELVHDYLAFSPVSATAAGYHVHNGIPLDEVLDDYSEQGMEQQRGFYGGFQQTIDAVDASKLDKEQKADLAIIKDTLSLTMLELTTIESYKHNPTLYVELAGNALFTPYVLNYAPKDKRFQQITKRLEKMPTLFEQAKANLVDAPEIWNRVAQEENDGNIELIDKTLRAEVPEAQRPDYDKAATRAIEALRGFSAFLKNDLSKKTSDWRLGKENYAKKFQYTLHTGKAPEQLLSEAEADLKKMRGEMTKLAAPKTVKQALDDIAKQHPTPDGFMDAAKAMLAQATDFVKEKGLVTMPARSNLQVIETPEFMRGIYSVAGFDPAPALEPQLGAFYWVTPIPKTWSKEQVDSKLREYNNFGLQEITIHEAMPGHYVQFEYANDVQPETRRLVRNIFGNGPYIEGWAFYTQQMMSEEGYLGGSGTEQGKALKMSFLKQALRALANTILDVRLQTMGMTDQQALDLMMNDTFQEKSEATGKLQRAQLSSCQLPTYYAGWKGWLEAREQEKARLGSGFTLREFHDRALKESAVPMPVLQELLK
ncbi:MAG TPA: DUF885 domain-containing protein [Bryobacteraceae bacterium]